MGIGCRAVTDNLRYGCGTTRQCVLEVLDHQDAGAFAHDEPMPVAIVRTRGAMRCSVKAGGKRPRSGKTPEAHQIDAGFGSAAHRDIRFTSRISRAASPMACTPAAQAVTGVPIGPL